MDYATTRKINGSGVSLAYLVEFAAVVAEDGNAGMSTRQVVELYVLPAAREHRCALVEAPDPLLMPREHVGRPSFLVCHAWSDNFCEMVAALAAHLAPLDPASTFVWLDVFAVDQAAAAAGRGEVVLGDALSLMEATVRLAAGVLVAMGREGAPLGRVWCLLEMWTALSVAGFGALRLLTPPGGEQRDVPGWARPIDIGAAATTLPSDKARILAWVDAFGGADALNATLQLALLLEPVDSLPVAQAHAHAASGAASKQQATWAPSRPHAQLRGQYTAVPPPASPILEPYVRWLRLPPPASGHRTLILSGREGEGASSVCAVICAAYSHAPHAAFFVDAADSRTCSAVRVVKSLAFQLAVALPAFSRALLPRLDAPSIRLLASPQDAVELLLARPLTALLAPTHTSAAAPTAAGPGAGKGASPERARLVKLPIMQSRRGTHTGGAGPGPGSVVSRSGVGGGGGAGGSNGTSGALPAQGIVLLLDGLAAAGGSGGVVDNSVLALLREHLLALPPCVRFVVSLPPVDAAREVVLAVTAHAVNPLTLAVHELQGLKEVQMVLVQQLAHTVPDPRASLMFVRRLLAACAGNLLHARLVVMGVCQQHAVVMAAGRDPSNPAPLHELCPSIPPTLPAAVRWLLKGAAPEGLAHRPQLAHLLNVLVAAREPLLVGQLAAMGLAGALTTLPAWGALFSLRHHAVHVVHPAVLDALRAGAAALPANRALSRAVTVTESRRSRASVNGAAAGKGEPPTAGGTGIGGSKAQEGAGADDEEDAWAVDAGAGHAALAELCLSQLRDTGSGCRLYALRCVFHHLGASPEAAHGQLVAALARDVRYWQAAYGAGVGGDALTDLAAYTVARPNAGLTDTLRWLEAAAPAFTQHPRAVWQLARDAPEGSVMRGVADNSAWGEEGASGIGGTPPRVDASCVSREPEWPPLLASLPGHTGGITCIALRHAGATAVPHGLVLGGCRSGALRLWDARRGALLAVLAGHTGAVDAVRFCAPTSVPGEALAASFSGMEGCARLWDVGAAACVAVVSGMTVTSAAALAQFRAVGSYDFHAAGGSKRFLARAFLDGSVEVREVTPEGAMTLAKLAPEALRFGGAREFKPVVEALAHEPVECSALSADRRRVATGSGEVIRVWDHDVLLRLGEDPEALVRAASHGLLLGLLDYGLVADRYTAQAAAAAATADATSAGAAAGAAAGRAGDSSTADDTGSGALPPGSSACVSGGGKSAQQGVGGRTGAAWLPLVGIARQETAAAPLRILDATGLRPLACLACRGKQERVLVVRLSPDGGLIATGGTDGVLRIWPAHPDPQPPASSPSSPRRTRSAGGAGGPGPQHGRAVSVTHPLLELGGHVAPITSLAFMAGPALHCVTGSADESLRIWDLGEALTAGVGVGGPDTASGTAAGTGDASGTDDDDGGDDVGGSRSPSPGRDQSPSTGRVGEEAGGPLNRESEGGEAGEQEGGASTGAASPPPAAPSPPAAGSGKLPPIKRGGKKGQGQHPQPQPSTAQAPKQPYRSPHRLADPRVMGERGRAGLAGASVLRPPGVTPHLHTAPATLPSDAYNLERTRAYDHIASAILDRRPSRRPSRPHLLAVLSGHERPVTAVDAAPDGLQFASGGADASVRLWRAKGRLWEQRAVLRGHVGAVTSLAFSPAPGGARGPGTRYTPLLASGSAGCGAGGPVVCVWAPGTGQLLLSLPTFCRALWLWAPELLGNDQLHEQHSPKGQQPLTGSSGRAATRPNANIRSNTAVAPPPPRQLCLGVASESLMRVLRLPPPERFAAAQPPAAALPTPGGARGTRGLGPGAATTAAKPAGPAGQVGGDASLTPTGTMAAREAGGALSEAADLYFMHDPAHVLVCEGGWVVAAGDTRAHTYHVPALVGATLDGGGGSSDDVTAAQPRSLPWERDGQASSTGAAGAGVVEGGGPEGGEGGVEDEVAARLADLHFLDAWRAVAERSSSGHMGRRR